MQLFMLFVAAAIKRFVPIVLMQDNQQTSATTVPTIIILMMMKSNNKNRQAAVSFFADKWYINAELKVKRFDTKYRLSNNYMYNMLNCFDSETDALRVVSKINKTFKGSHINKGESGILNFRYVIRENLMIQCISACEESIKPYANNFKTRTIAEMALLKVNNILATSRTSKHPYTLLNHLRFWFSTFRFKLPR